jgi:tetratricopeptide (TPR) repeat protein
MRLRLLIPAFVLFAVAIQPVSRPGYASADATPPLAVLMSCQGDVTVVREDGTSVKGAFGLPLAAGDEVHTGKNAEADILFENGNYISIGENSNMTVRGSKIQREKTAPTKPMGDKGFEVAQNFLKLQSSEASSSIAPLRSGERGEELRAVSPQQTRVADDRPTFVWTSANPDEELLLTLYNDEGVWWKTTVEGDDELVYPDDAPVLTAGTTYSWTLETTDPLRFPPLRSKAAYFELIPEEERAALEADLDRIDRDGSLSPVSRRIMRASLYFDHKLLDDAVAETERAVEMAPEDPALLSILARLYSEIGRTDEAMVIYDGILRKR